MKDQHIVINKGDHYECKRCEFTSDDLTAVSQHVVENQFVVSTTK